MYSKIKLYWKSHYLSILIFIGIILVISPFILSRNLNNLDEIWNYNFARNVADGLVPYRDFNMVQTPLLPLIAGLMLKLFGNELIVMRVLAILLIASIFFMIYKVLKLLKINTLYNLLFLLLLFLLFKQHICIDYNFALLFLTLILIYLELKTWQKINLSNDYEAIYFKQHIFYYFRIGFICGCCILLKQTTGVLISFASVIFPIFFCKNKIDFKGYVKSSFLKILGILVPIFILLIYLISNNALDDFIDYTILGIKTFSNSISYTTLISSQNIVIKLLSIGLPVFILVSLIYMIRKKAKNLYGFYAYGIASLIVIYPISDHIHFLIGITPLLTLLAYFLLQSITHFLENEKSTQEKNNKSKFILKLKLYLGEFLKPLIELSLICYIIASCCLLYNYFYNPEKEHSINHYRYIPISEQLLNKINDINNFILFNNSKTYILDSEAAIYMIALNKYNKNFDMFLKGNLGSKGEFGQIEKINVLEKGTKILIKNDQYKLNWQTPLEVISYLKNNFNKIGEINIFDIYEI